MMRQVHLAEGLDLLGLRARQVLVVACVVVRVQDVDAAVVVVDLEAQAGEAREQRVDVIVDVRV